MSKKRLLVAAAAVVAGALALSACTPQATSSNTARVNTESTATVMWNQPFYGYNNLNSFGNATANTNIVYLTNDQLQFYDKDLNIVTNKSFGTYEKTSDNPLTIKVTIADTATWSDGVKVSPADFLLAYAAQSGLYNTKQEATTDKDGNTVKNPEGTVYFDSSSPSLALITAFPKIEGNTFTYSYSKPYADWEKPVITPGVPAHIVAKRALGTTDPTAAQQELVTAFQNKDNAKLAKIANVWNLDFNYNTMPADKDLVVGSGPYVISDLKKDEYVTVSRNPNYKGEHKPAIDKITVRFNEDPMAAVQALGNKEVMLISPQSTSDVLKAAQALPDVEVKLDVEGTYEHIDPTFNNGGPFDPKKYGGDATKALKVRQAFLHTIPRQKIYDRIIKPLNPANLIRNSYETVPGSPMYDAVTKANGMLDEYGNDANIAKAKALLAEAGVTSPSVRILYAQKNERRIQEFQLIKESAEQAGFKIIDNGNPNWGDKLGDKTYDAALFGWQSTSTAVTGGEANYRAAEKVNGKDVPAGQNNYGGYTNTAINRLYDELAVTVDQAKQQDLLIKIEQTLVKDAFSLTLYQFPGVTAYSKNLSGVEKMALSPTIFWNFWEWKLAS